MNFGILCDTFFRKTIRIIMLISTTIGITILYIIIIQLFQHDIIEFTSLYAIPAIEFTLLNIAYFSNIVFSHQYVNKNWKTTIVSKSKNLLIKNIVLQSLIWGGISFVWLCNGSTFRGESDPQGIALIGSMFLTSLLVFFFYLPVTYRLLFKTQY